MNEENIIPHKWKKGQSGNPAGRPKKISNVLKQIPPDAQEKIMAVLFSALRFSNAREAAEYVKSQEAVAGEYGFVLQLAVKQLLSKWGWDALNDILDRLFGKARIKAEVAHQGGISLNVITDEETARAIEEGLG